MQYMLLIYGDESARAHATKEQMGQMFAAYGAYTEAMKKAGVRFIVVGSPGVVDSKTFRPADADADKVYNKTLAQLRDMREKVLHARVVAVEERSNEGLRGASPPGGPHSEARPRRREAVPVTLGAHLTLVDRLGAPPPGGRRVVVRSEDLDLFR